MIEAMGILQIIFCSALNISAFECDANSRVCDCAQNIPSQQQYW